MHKKWGNINHTVKETETENVQMNKRKRYAKNCTVRP